MTGGKNVTRPQHVLDVTGYQCPLPVLHARKRLIALAPGDELLVLANDPVARLDLPHFCAEAGHDLLETHEHNGIIEYLIRRGPDRHLPDSDD